MGKPHQAYAVTAGVATAVAAMLPGSLVHAMCDPKAVETGHIRIGHPSGVMRVEATICVGADGAPAISRVAIERTARRIMDGFVYVPLHVLR
jgi:2-methylaconitate cis-trans-isomerase PrpF